MIAVIDIPADEQVLARLLCEKLAKFLGGMLSVGLSSLHLESPLSFFAGRNRPILAMIEVLRHTGVKPGSDTALDLQKRFAVLAQTVDDVFRLLTALSAWSNMSKDELHRLGGELSGAYSTSLAMLEELQRALNGSSDYSQQKIRGQNLIEGNITELECLRSELKIAASTCSI